MEKIEWKLEYIYKWMFMKIIHFKIYDIQFMQFSEGIYGLYMLIVEQKKTENQLSIQPW